MKRLAHTTFSPVKYTHLCVLSSTVLNNTSSQKYTTRIHQKRFSCKKKTLRNHKLLPETRKRKQRPEVKWTLSQSPEVFEKRNQSTPNTAKFSLLSRVHACANPGFFGGTICISVESRSYLLVPFPDK
jgi:hypothetical protein